MQNDALDAGIRPGGLRSKQDIKILVCYVLDKTGVKLTRTSLEQALISSQLVNYFEVSDCLSDLIAKGNVKAEDNFCVLTSTGKRIAAELKESLPPSVRDRAVETALNLFEREKRERENAVNVTPSENGLKVECKILGGEDGDLLSIALSVADREQAKVIKEHFLEKPDIIYSAVIALLTGNNDFIKDTLNRISEEKSEKR
ncbi:MULTISPECIES: DUF4364 family protein [unclassified Ruminococcus]|uniref:DUF4364 family protein n=1 Tax=unclassified Ruminococcus TaxID=2608920 RepID=UPI00210C0A2C|nr:MULTISPECIES: DUF4364 family protein [unclassified Ruminococcus]MCQ4022712.1 DUF4364 family protein [Ruminococcus sp. zg-924]MCQ4114952.1 DUF4364 family protein [Ruminococcus sp. zg-921]